LATMTRFADFGTGPTLCGMLSGYPDSKVSGWQDGPGQAARPALWA
jgi:hypothetical protein